ncbi:ATP-binding protein [Actinomadura sp. K4S16]|uniref:ATP-binding protein n=1 Tax=Actinomadura sp. K4S16 TaxID=1316147 RepID=UPI0011EFDB5E|nr:ATP-binding protein [Actinomadura sp. K4S16]
MRLEGTVSGPGRLNQAGRDLKISKSTVLPPEVVRPVSEVGAPPGLVNVPGHQQVFVGRDGELDELDKALRAPGGVVVAAVHGLGGVGKSTLAAHYAATHAVHAEAEKQAGLASRCSSRCGGSPPTPPRRSRPGSPGWQPRYSRS